MATAAEQEAKRALRASVSKNKDQVLMAEETLRLLRDGDKINEKASGIGPDKEGDGMDANAQRIVNVLAGLVLAFLGWWSNNIWSTVQSMQAQITTLNVKIVETYTPRTEMQSNLDRIYSKLDAIDKQVRK